MMGFVDGEIGAPFRAHPFARAATLFCGLLLLVSCPASLTGCTTGDAEPSGGFSDADVVGQGRTGAISLEAPLVDSDDVYGVGDTISRKAATYGNGKPVYVDVDVRLDSVSAESRLPQGVAESDLLFTPSPSLGADEPVAIADDGTLSEGWSFVTVSVSLLMDADERARIAVNDMAICLLSEDRSQLDRSSASLIWCENAGEDSKSASMPVLEPGEWAEYVTGYLVPTAWISEDMVLVVDRSHVGSEVVDSRVFLLSETLRG